MQLFSQNLYVLRKAWNLSQTALAVKFGVATGSYSRWENGTEPTYETLVALSKYFKISIDRLLTEELTPQTVPPRWGKEHIHQVSQNLDKGQNLEETEGGDTVEGLLIEIFEKIKAVEEGHAELKKDVAELRATRT